MSFVNRDHSAFPAPAGEPAEGVAVIARALAAALAAHHFSTPAVRGALAQFVRRSRDAGAPPERVLVDLKALLRPVEARAREAGAASDERREQLVRSAISLYYQAD